MRIDLLVRFRNCEDLKTYISKMDIEVIGIEIETFTACWNTLLEIKNQSLLVVPRKIFESNRARLTPRLSELRRIASSCIPKDLATARSLAKIPGLYTIALTPSTIMFVDETQVNLLTQVKSRKYIEVYMQDFINTIFGDRKVSTERLFYFLGETIERALKRDVGIFISSASAELKKVLHPKQIDAILHSLGFTKRERKLILEIYPLEFLSKWLES